MSHTAAVFTMIMMLNLAVPIILPFGTCFFLSKYIIDKYNLLYVYP